MYNIKKVFNNRNALIFIMLLTIVIIGFNCFTFNAIILISIFFIFSIAFSLHNITVCIFDFLSKLEAIPEDEEDESIDIKSESGEFSTIKVSDIKFLTEMGAEVSIDDSNKKYLKINNNKYYF